MATIVTRSGKGSELTFAEMDANFTNLNTDKIELTNLSVTDSGGDGSLAYNNSTGVITYTGPSAAEVRAHITAGEGIDISSGEISGEDATDSNKGIASFSSSNFTVSSGAVSVKTDGINDTHIDFGTGTNQVSSADVPEQTNLYYTDARARASISASGSLSYNSSTGALTYTQGNTDTVAEGSSNLYYTAERVDDQVNTLMTAGSNISLTYDDTAGTLTVAATGTATTINNNADNRVITGSGTADTLNGESTLLYDGTSLSNTTAPTFTEASTPIQLNGTQPNAGGYNVYKSINTGTSRGGQGYRSQPSAPGSGHKVDTHTLFFDLDDDYGLRPGGSYQGDRNFYLQANHTADQLSIYMDGFSNNTIESFDGANGSYGRTPIELHGSTTTIKAGGTAALTATSSTLTAGVELDMDGDNIKLGGGDVDLEGGNLVSTGGSIAFSQKLNVDANGAGQIVMELNNSSATAAGLQIDVGTPTTANHSSGDALVVRRGKTGSFQEVFKVSSAGTDAAQGIVTINNIDALTNQDTGTPTTGAPSGSPTGYIEIVINGVQRFIPYYT